LFGLSGRSSDRHWVIEEGRYGPRMRLRGTWSRQARDAWEAEDVRELVLGQPWGWQPEDLSYLVELPHLYGLEIAYLPLKDDGIVSRLSSLRWLKLDTYSDAEIDFGGLPNLEQVRLNWRPKAKSLLRHAGVKSLVIYGGPGSKDLTGFADMHALRSLYLIQSKLRTLDGIHSLAALKSFRLKGLPSLASVEGLHHLQDVEHIELSHCRKVFDLSPMRDLPRLRVVKLYDLGDIESLSPLGSLRNLEYLSIYGKTNIVDGDFSALVGLEKIRYVGFMDHPHYSHRSSDFPAPPDDELFNFTSDLRRRLNKELFGVADEL